jgi:hypothetical protein
MMNDAAKRTRIETAMRLRMNPTIAGGLLSIG